MRRKEVLFAVIGGIVGAVLVMATGSFSPLGAQNEVREVYFDEIRCRRINVVDGEGVTRVYITAAENEYGGAVVVRGG